MKMVYKKKIVLFNPRAHPDDYNIRLPLSVLCVASLVHKEYDVKITFDVPDRDYHKDVLDLCEDAVCLGIHAMTGYQIKDGLKLCKLVKKKYSDLPIIWGGYHPTILPRQTLENPYVDFVVRGYGRTTFKELVDALESKRTLKSVKGIGYKKNGKIYFNGEREFEDINKFPEIPYYLVKERLKNQNVVEYVTSFGCPYDCAFCAENIMSERKWRALKAERVVKEMGKLVSEFNVKEINIADSNFFVDKERVIKICKGLVENNIKVKWSCEGRVDMLIKFTAEEWRLFKKSGCSSILVGAESGRQEDLDFINKRVTVEQIKKTIKIAAEHNIPLNLSCFVGLPSMNLRKSLNATIDLLDYSMKHTNDNVMQILLYTPYPGSPLYELSKKYGFEEPKSLEGWSTFELNTRNIPWVSEKDAEMVEMIHRWYIIPFLTGIYKRAIFDKVKRFRFVTDFVYLVYYNLARFRWKHKFFGFPIEYQFIKLVKSHLKSKRGFDN
jgi:radical SAM superfamily enzyme YgiQ (UPF0313 family)